MDDMDLPAEHVRRSATSTLNAYARCPWLGPFLGHGKVLQMPMAGRLAWRDVGQGSEQQRNPMTYWAALRRSERPWPQLR
jgi:hypothetical protein